MKRTQSDSASSNHDEGGVKRVLDRWLAQGMQGTLGVTTKREREKTRSSTGLAMVQVAWRGGMF